MSEPVCHPPPQYCDSPKSAPFSPRFPELIRYKLISVIFNSLASLSEQFRFHGG